MTKITLLPRKTFKKHMFTENISYLVGGRRGGISCWPEKKIVSVGTFSTFCHPIDPDTLKLFICILFYIVQNMLWWLKILPSLVRYFDVTGQKVGLDNM